jgi:predicted NUDIX family NTP pyrophosphohydrolase
VRRRTIAGKLSAGLLLFDEHPDSGVRVMLAHMGGPFWARKDAGAWSIPKGEHDLDEDPLAAARREFAEELGVAPPSGELIDLGEIKQRGGKRVRAWAVRAYLDVSDITSNTFEMEWPRGSGRTQHFPEIDRAEWFDLATARSKLVQGQVAFLDVLSDRLGVGGSSPAR